MHERLIDIEFQRGRRILIDKVKSVEDVVELRTKSPTEYELVNRTLAMFDIFALYAERRYIDKDLVFSEWGYTLAAIWQAGGYFITERLNRQPPKTWSAWPHFQELGNQSLSWVSNRPPPPVPNL